MNMIRRIDSLTITETVRKMCVSANCVLPSDMRKAISDSISSEDFMPAKEILERIRENYELAAAEGVPICQDTGVVVVFVEIGQDVHVIGDLVEAINLGVRLGYSEGFLRASLVADPLRRVNTGDNTPAMIHFDIVPGSRFKITVAPKGFGSENMSRIAMLTPSEGIDGVVNFVLNAVEEAGANPCPPVIVGVGIGGTFDKAALLAKKAVFRPVDDRHHDDYYAQLEDKLLESVNSLGIGPQGFGGRTSALAVKIETMPTHIAGLPVAVNLNCHAARHISEEL